MRISRSLLLAALIVVVLTVVSVPLLNIAVYTPARTVESYIAAIAAGDANRAFSYLSSPTPSSTLALDHDVLEAAPDLPRNASAETVSTDGDRAEVRLTYTLDSRSQSVTLHLVRLPAAAGLFSRWAIEQKAWPTLDLEVDGSSTATVNGYTVNAGEVPVLFPAVYRVGFDGTFLKAQAQRAAITAPGEARTVSLSPVPTDALRSTVAHEVSDHLKQCVKSTTLLPSGCVFGWDTDNEIIGTVKWELVSEPAVSLTAKGNDLELTPATAEVRVQGRYRDIVTAAEHDLDEKLSFVLGGSVAVHGSEVAFTPRRVGDVTVVTH